MSGLVSSWYNNVIANQTATAARVFMLYDFLINSDREVNAFWRKPVTAASILFFSNKYISILNHILASVTALPKTDKLHTTRPSGVHHRARAIPAMGSIFCDASSGAEPKSDPRSNHRCSLHSAIHCELYASRPSRSPFRHAQVRLFHNTSGFRSHKPRRLTAISRSSLILADVVLIVITWGTIPNRHIAKREPSSLLARILLLDGTVYFIMLLILNSLHITFTLLSIFGTGGSSNMTAFTEPVTSVLTSRFLLDIQEASRRSAAAMSTGGSESSSGVLYFSTSRASWSSFSRDLSTPMAFSFQSESPSCLGGADSQGQ
ncbi:hypothetical protein OH76DRAFT_318540 [Lentinus brumalis]|uniref:DUF6533 domain-containing protein n=1 Tax=Lentinus brumalis TaxID=2498619 RepID=A0A371DFB1_9APHY|nr:hypothetical protein OH76DRAFT_318540 [Polyporus brumalis]